MHNIWSLLYVLLLTWTVTNGQFLYNYEEEQSPEQQPETQESTPYKYNPPSAIEQYYPESLRSPPRAEPEPEPVRYKTSQDETQASPRGYRNQPEPAPVEYQAEPEIAYDPEYSAEPPRRYRTNQQRRRSRRRYSRVRQREPEEEEEIIETPIRYSPSVFENIALGEAPDGIHVPKDSLLNLLRSDTPRTQARHVGNTQYSPEVNIVDVSNQQPPRSEISHQSDVSPFLGQTPTQQYRPPQQQQAPQRLHRPVVPQSEPEPRFFVQPPQDEPRVESPQPVYYRPSSQEIQQTEYRRQRNQVPEQQPPAPRAYRPAPQASRSYRPPAPAPRTYRPPPPASSPRVPQRQNRQPPARSEYNADSYQDFSEEPSVRRFEEAPRDRRRVQEPVTQSPSVRPRPTFKPARLAIAELPDDTDGDGIPGEAGVDYPTLHSIPTTSFSCRQQPHNGYYADLETSCQVVHLCQSGGEKDSFLCPNGTIFSQEKFACQWWYKVNCQNAPRYYSTNDRLYKIPGESKKK